MAGHSLGIDFGTSTTLIAVATRGGTARVLPIGEVHPWMPSVAGLDPDGCLVVGEVALQLDPRRVIRSAKARVTSGDDRIEVAGQFVEARTVVKAILAEAIGRATKAMPTVLSASKVYLGCPALWTGAQRRLLADVVHELGIDVDVADIIDEPVAAGLHSIHTQAVKGGKPISGKTVVFDAGGGTLDVAYLDVTRNKRNEFTVLSAEGIPVSGDAVDLAIARHLETEINGVEDRQLAELLLLARSRELKEGLSRDSRRTVALGGGFDVQVSLSRPELEALFDPQLSRSVALTKSAVRGSLLRVQQVPTPDQIRRTEWEVLARPILNVVLVGGLSQMPVIAECLGEVFPEAEVTLVESPQESVALGLAMGDQLNRLNLPRPPVDFVVEFGPPELLQRLGLEDWAKEHRSVYEAFTPLYQWHDLMKGNSRLAYRFEVPYPPGVNAEFVCTIRAQSPDRERSALDLRVKRTNSEEVLEIGVAAGVTTGHSWHRRLTFTLYTNGDLLITGSRGEIFRFRVQRWPVLRGRDHDFAREVELEHVSTEPYGSRIKYDDWRFN